MLAVTVYRQDYVDACRAGAKAQLAAFRKLMAAAPAAAASFAPGYFVTQVLALDHFFLHRQRSFEGKAGGPLNELRMLCDGIKENGGVLAANSTIKYDAAKSVTGLAVGAKIVLDDKTYERLSNAVFDEIEAKYR
ncbi:MAG: hypothetical protein EOP22_19385 [Hyphomicrobiales bacterium]|nr:MAG: hypothetical protein EOP22_19385 [Hyphomicrobiales bacterium]